MDSMLMKSLKVLQSKLGFEDWGDYPQFSTEQGLGRVALTTFFLTIVGTTHCVVWLIISLERLDLLHINLNSDLLGNNNISSSSNSSSTFLFDHHHQDNHNHHNHRWTLLWQWCAYMTAICCFHLLEFFVTALYNPTQAHGNSFLVNHSVTYTAAALTSWTEFWVRFWFLPSTTASSTTNSLSFWLSPCWIGCILVVISQIIRSWSMATAGESFNHVIQTRRKDNHVLVTRGIYRYFRHPSYVGFFYWSIGTQLILGNLLHSILFTYASWTFFSRRIPYEEESLCQHFPDEYPAYVARTWMGIPFIRSIVGNNDTGRKQD